MPMRSKLRMSKSLSVLAFLLVAGFLLHLPSELGVSLSIPPDSQEYSFGLANLFEHGKFGFTLNGEWYPSRYAPWFSLFCLSPAYFLFGGDVLALHWAIVAFALAFLVISYEMAKLAGLGKWSLVCAVLPMFIPNFVFFSRMVMTEIPYVALFAASALAFVRFVESEKPSALFSFGVGALVAWTGAVRVTGLPMLVLYFIAALFKKCGRKRKLLDVVVMSLPTLAYVLASLAYNNSVFGTPFRNGYHYWVSVPCDFHSLTFNLSHAISNVTRYLGDPMMLMTLFVVAVVLIASVLMLCGHLGGLEENVRFLLLSGYVLFQGVVLATLYV